MSQPVKRGLGRGLDALLGTGDAAAVGAARSEAMREVPVDMIRPNPQQPRKTFDAAALDDLRASIEQYGVLVPIIVREIPSGYELVAGERRWRACAALGRSTIPAIVRRSDDRDTLEVAIVENLQRENLNALEEAAGIAQLIDDYGLTQDEAARRLGKSRPVVANAVRLLALPDRIKALIVDGSLSAGHARALLAVPRGEQIPLAERVVREHMSVRDVERLATQNAKPPTPAAKRIPRDVHDAEFEERLRQRFQTRIGLQRSGKGGRIEIRFDDETALLRIADLLLGDA